MGGRTYQWSLQTRNLHDPFQRRCTHRHRWATMVALGAGATVRKTVAFVGGAFAPAGPAKQMAAAMAKAPKTPRMVSSLNSMPFRPGHGSKLDFGLAAIAKSAAVMRNWRKLRGKSSRRFREPSLSFLHARARAALSPWRGCVSAGDWRNGIVLTTFRTIAPAPRHAIIAGVGRRDAAPEGP